MFGTVGSPYLLIQAINIILTHILPNVVVLFLSAKLRFFCRNYQILLRKSSERQVIHAYLTHDTTFGFFSSIRS